MEPKDGKMVIYILDIGKIVYAKEKENSQLIKVMFMKEHGEMIN